QLFQRTARCRAARRAGAAHRTCDHLAIGVRGSARGGPSDESADSRGRGMSRPKGEYRSAQHEGNPMSPPGRPKGEYRSAQHEGGRVQRFREGFTAIPAMRTLGEQWDRDVSEAGREATRLGWTLSSELRARGIDFSFAPVLDLDHGASGVIGDRAFHRNPNAVAHLA